MIDICVEQLAEMIGGVLRLASMPPLAGGMEPVRRIVVDTEDITSGDTFWFLGASGGWAWGRVQLAFMRGACGVITDTPGFEPWAGKYILEVEDSPTAMVRLVRSLSARRQPTLHLFGGTAATRGVTRLVLEQDWTTREIVEAFGQPAGPIPA